METLETDQDTLITITAKKDHEIKNEHQKDLIISQLKALVWKNFCITIPVSAISSSGLIELQNKVFNLPETPVPFINTFPIVVSAIFITITKNVFSQVIQNFETTSMSTPTV